MSEPEQTTKAIACNVVFLEYRLIMVDSLLWNQQNGNWENGEEKERD